MKATTKKIQNHIDDKYGKGNFEFVKANGYFYIVPPESMIEWPESIYVNALHQMPFEQWIGHIDYSIDAAVEIES